MRVLPARFHPARRGVRGDQAAQVLPDPDVVVVVVPIVAVHGAQVPWGKVVIGRGASRAGQAPGKHAPRPPGGAGTGTGRRPGRPGPGPLPPCPLARNASRASSPSLAGCSPRGGRDGQAPATVVAGQRRAPSARAASLASSAACLSHPMSLWPGPRPCPRSCPDPYARDWRTLSPAGGRITAGHAPRGASRPQKPRPTGPPRGEWSGRAGWCASRD